MHYHGAKNIVRINSDDKTDEVADFAMSETDFRFVYCGSEISLSDIESVWYRKGSFWFPNLFPPVDAVHSQALSGYLDRSLANENRHLREYFHSLIESRARILGSAKRSSLNKLITLKLASTIGLKTPPFFISNNRAELEQKLAAGGGFITKAIADGVYFWDVEEARRAYFSYTERLRKGSFENYGPTLAPSLIQEEIKKQLELRIFYLDGQFYATAIFSQADRKTSVDFRKYNNDRPNRSVPYQLPSEIIQLLRSLFQKLDLNTGSVDMIVADDGDYYFLEINPVGHFSAVGYSCGYNLESEVAKWLVGRPHG